MDRLTDPRRFRASGATHPLLELVALGVEADEHDRGAKLLHVRQTIAEQLDRGLDTEIRSALEHVPDAQHYRVLWDALAHVAESPPVESGAAIARVFALPVILIAENPQACMISGSLPDIGAVQSLFERSGALGPMRNFGLSNALCSLAALESLSALEIFRAGHSLDAAAIRTQLPPAEISVTPGREQSHLRFIVGAGISAANAPGFAETGANIGAWGMELSKLLARQLTNSGLQLLVVPRPPRGLLNAAHAGRCAQLDVALNLFVSNTVRRFRTSAGDPSAILSTHDDCDLRLTLSSPYAEDLVDGFRWPLAARDDLNDLQRMILQLLSDVRVTDVRVFPSVLPATRTSGGNWHPRVDEWTRLVARGAQH